MCTGHTGHATRRVRTAESAEHQDATGDILLAVLSSTDGGASWRTRYVARSQQQPRCPTKDCPTDCYGAQAALAVGPAGTIMTVYAANATPQAPMRPYEITSADGGRSWTGSPRRPPSRRRAWGSSPPRPGTAPSAAKQADRSTELLRTGVWLVVSLAGSGFGIALSSSLITMLR